MHGILSVSIFLFSQYYIRSIFLIALFITLILIVIWFYTLGQNLIIAFPIVGPLDYVQRISEKTHVQTAVSFQFKIIPDNKQHGHRASVSL